MEKKKFWRKSPELTKTTQKISLKKKEEKKFWRKSPKLSRNFGEFSKTFEKIFNIRKKSKKWRKKSFGENLQNYPEILENSPKLLEKSSIFEKNQKNGEKKVLEKISKTHQNYTKNKRSKPFFCQKKPAERLFFV